MASTVVTGANYVMDVFDDPYNKRIRIDDIKGSFSEAIAKAEELAVNSGAEKLIVKGRKEQFVQLLENGYQCEAMIDRFFLGSDCYFCCKYFNNNRRDSNTFVSEDEIVKDVQLLDRNFLLNSPPDEYKLIFVQKEEVEMLAKLYQQVFKLYPTPLHDPAYILKTLDEGTIYVAFKNGNQVVSAASAEINDFYKNAELTDCATLPEHRQYGFMKILLTKLEEKLVAGGIFCAYSIARAQSFGMNAALHQLGYRYRGRLTNNCYIFDKIENMNMWVKDLSQ
ncbi:putative beta-lysine N-acetyltransferase [Robertmurraya sp. FSL W8-0741]|uniref:putative beta-lysine N-acetyltransferase n=1 Tax=Robertmurraya TaxID=2837507 RepID=UPI000BA5BFE8|nr:putative beta-lysine N-acetyltransferase [Robertmurraya siralis]PAE22158.1 putative beta-lysine N-acetyltransferase [Bacillus sp. 7504-2]